jgi:phage shock protein PspC (stress-responsive transcriptional regulator)/anti-sigma regulatory factor (Ser/Thr protein kinase)
VTIDEMSAATGSPSAAGPSLRRDPHRGLVAGVLAGLGARTGIDPVILRVAFVIGAILSGGLLLLAYVVAWVVLPAGDAAQVPLARLDLSRVRSTWRVATGVGLLTLSALLAFRELGIWWSDALVWPLVLAAFGASLLWGRFRAAGTARERTERPWAAGTPPPSSTETAGVSSGADARSRFADLYRGVFGVLFVLGAALLFLSWNDFLGGLRDAALTTVVVMVALGLILAPFLWRLGRNLATERAERIRSQDRAEVAAHLHDSVLQTLTLMQKRAGDPREVSALARRQERELRDWLAGGDRRSTESIAAALRSAAEEVEDDHRVAVEVVVVGDAALDERAEAVLGAAREALLNAARHAPEPGPIRVYAEIDETSIEVYVRDRGPGFELDSVPRDRRGVRESIVGRMERAGGNADVRSIPDGGTEVGITIRRASPASDGEKR